MAEHGTRPVIVVGTDGSPGSIEAMRWALRQAQATGAEVRVVLAWEVTVPLAYVPNLDDGDWWADIARKAVEDATAAEPDVCVPISNEVVNGHPSNVLVEASKAADLLVVGSRGHGRVLEMVLGSVSNHCTHHAHCTVVVVRSPAPDAQNRASSDVLARGFALGLDGKQSRDFQGTPEVVTGHVDDRVAGTAGIVEGSATRPEHWPRTQALFRYPCGESSVVLVT
jgi:nucleotide-binding universal stress UspA family protein